MFFIGNDVYFILSFHEHLILSCLTVFNNTEFDDLAKAVTTRYFHFKDTFSLCITK